MSILLLLLALPFCAHLQDDDSEGKQDNPYEDQLEKLSADSLIERSEAEDELVKAGAKAVPYLIKARSESEDAELRARLRSALKRIGGPTLDYLDTHPKEIGDLGPLFDEIYQERFKPFVPTYMSKYVTVEYGKAPKADLSKLVIRFEEGTGSRREAKGATYYRAKLVEEGFVVDRARYGADELWKVDRATLTAKEGRSLMRMMLFASALKVSRENKSGGWGSSSMVLLGVRLEEEGRSIYTDAYWSTAGSTGQVKYLPMQTMQNLMKDGLKKAEWKDEKLSEKFRDDILLRLGDYISPRDGSNVGSAKDISQKVKEAIEKE